MQKAFAINLKVLRKAFVKTLYVIAELEERNKRRVSSMIRINVNDCQLSSDFPWQKKDPDIAVKEVITDKKERTAL